MICLVRLPPSLPLCGGSGLGVGAGNGTGKDPDAGKDQRQEEKGMTEDEMAGWHHQLDGHESEQALGVGDGQGNLACCSL